MIHARQIQARQAACAGCPQKEGCRSRFKVCDTETGCPTGAHAKIDADHAKQPAPVRTLHCDIPPGVGSKLKELLGLVAISSSPECNCDAMAAQMDYMGKQWCLDNIGVIIDAMEAEATRRGWPATWPIARLSFRVTAETAIRFAVSLT